MDNQTSKFERYEKLFFRINLSMFGLSVFLYFLYLWFIEHLGPFVDHIMTVIIFASIAIIVIFFISIIRILKFIMKHRSEENSSIWRSVINIFLSPLSLIIFYILMFVTAMASCTYGG